MGRLEQVGCAAAVAVAVCCVAVGSNQERKEQPDLAVDLAEAIFPEQGPEQAEAGGVRDSIGGETSERVGQARVTRSLPFWKCRGRRSANSRGKELSGIRQRLRDSPQWVRHGTTVAKCVIAGDLPTGEVASSNFWALFLRPTPPAPRPQPCSRPP